MLERLSKLTGMQREEIDQDIERKKKILQWLVENEVDNIEGVGRIVAEYYSDKEQVYSMIEENANPEEITSSEQ